MVMRFTEMKKRFGKKGSFEHRSQTSSSENGDCLYLSDRCPRLSLAICMIPYCHIHSVCVLRGRSKLLIYVRIIDN